MSVDPYAATQEVYELRSQLDRALTRIDELVDQNRQLMNNWNTLYLTHVKVLRETGLDVGLHRPVDE